MQYALWRSTRVFATALVIVLAGAVVALGMGGLAHASSGRARSAAARPNITVQTWGTVNGQTVHLYTLTNAHRMKVRISDYGGVVQSIYAADRRGRVRNVALGFPSLSGYVNDFQNQPWPAAGGSGDTYFGAIIGRYANRIANHQFTLNGVTYNLPGNNGTNNINTLHGGPNAFNTKVWAGATFRGTGAVGLQLTYTDPDGYNGFPGAVTTVVTYTLTNSNALRIHYRATTSKPTVVNFTNHTYFNLAGEGSGHVYGQLLRINASRYTPINANLIPTGALVPVARTPFDFRRLKPIGRDIRRGVQQLLIAHGYDHNWVLNGSGLRLAAFAEDPASGRTLTTSTDQPGVQLYSSNFLVGDLVGPSGRTYRQTDGFTLETQHFPNSPNQPNFPSTVLNPGQVFNSTTIYKLGVAR